MATWYVRPSGGTYGAEDGTSYADAWDGAGNVTWGVGGVIAGDTLYICGTHNERFALTAGGSSGSPLTVRGDYQADPGIIDGENTTVWGISSDSNDYIHVINITVNNNGTLGNDGGNVLISSSTGAYVYGVTANGGYWDGILLEQCIDSTAEYCTANGNNIRGIALSAATGTLTNCHIVNCTANGNGRRGGTISGNTNVASLTDSTIRGCTIRDNGEGIELEYCSNCEATGNTIINNNRTGTDLDHTGQADGFGVGIVLVQNVRIVRNHIDGTRQWSIVMTGSAGIKVIADITGNTILNAQEDGVRTEPNSNGGLCRIVGNYISGIDATVRLTLIYPHSTGVEVSNNTFVSGIAAFRTAGTITNGICKNNVFEQQRDYCFFNNSAGNTIDIDGNVYNLGPSGIAEIQYNATNKTGAAIADFDTNYLDEDPLLDASKAPTNANAIGTALAIGTPYAMGIDGEPFPSVDRDRGCVQGTDATNHPFHPLNL